MIKAILTIQQSNRKTFIDSVNQTELDLTIDDPQENHDDGLITMNINGFNSSQDIRLISILNFLRENRMPFSLEWIDLATQDGGEVHYRTSLIDEQYLSWTHGQKNVVDIESVRTAILDGEIRLFELLDRKEQEFTPWEWNTVAA